MCSNDGSDTGTVVSITDGDTLVASVHGKNEIIRLLNIDTPETKDPNKPVECLGAQATSFLRGLLPVGSKIKLQYDVERKDKYDRTLAAVFTPGSTFASADIARAGFGTAVAIGKNTKFLPPVKDAEKEAKASARGLYDPSISCTLPAQVADVSDSLETATATSAGSTAAATSSLISVVAPAITTAKSLRTLLQTGKTSTNMVVWAAFDDLELATHIKSLSAQIETAESNLAALKKTETSLAKAEGEAAAKKLAAEAAAKVEAAQAKAAAEEQKRVEAAAKAQAEAAAAEAERIRNLPPVYVPPAPAPYVPPVQDTGGAYPGYNGPRCYAPGGKTWRPC
ncbi:thermonuclease family protein [Arthrobacter sp.]|uniref:thermonuclease family protein n=1 Tax=Arthrobacter sp. TaxID=1667 RepID=UPI0026DED8A5|nr:thermonuclease family protein [Arthrobacter sp.]MDO5751982.1 thermonuclease family protein [Arthrobacter sp.]